MSTIMDYAYLRAAGEGYFKKEPHYRKEILLEREIAVSTTNIFKGVLGFLRRTISFISELLEKQRANRMRTMKGCCGSSSYLKGLV